MKAQLGLAVAVALLLVGCTDGKEDDTESTSSASTQIEQTDCSGATFDGFNAEEVAEIVESAEDGADIVIEETTPVSSNAGGFDQQIRTFKVTFIQGCNNTVVNNDNDTISDDDISSNVDLDGGSE